MKILFSFSLFLVMYDSLREVHVWILGYNYNFMDTTCDYVNMDFNDEQVKFIRVDNGEVQHQRC
ncbi:MAG: hypothetical protein IPL08_13145 [Saprospiraceae bacterium]|nr:hypothetical protein [Saprospiraceae bacterium]